MTWRALFDRLVRWLCKAIRRMKSTHIHYCEAHMRRKALRFSALRLSLIFRRQVLQHRPGIDRALDAHIVLADVATAAFSDAAFHLVFDGRIDLFILEAKLIQVLDHELDHDRRSAGDRDGVIRYRILVHHGCRHEAAITGPPLLCLVDGQVHIDRISQLLEFRAVHDVARGAPAVKHGDVLEIGALRHRSGDHRPDWRETAAATDKIQILPAQVIHRKAVAVRAADADDIAHFQFIEGGTHPPHAHDAELLVFLDQRRGGNRDHRFATAEDGKHRALTALMVEEFAVHRLDAESFNGAFASHLFLDGGDPGQLRKIDVIRHVQLPY